MQRLSLRLRLAALAVLLALGAESMAFAVGGPRQYTVQPGDTLGGISASSGVPVSRLAELNSLQDLDRIIAGRTLLLDETSDESPPTAQPATPPAATANREHVVRPGESLSQIARAFGLSTAALAQANGLADPNRLVAGQRLVVPGAATSSVSPVASAASPASPAGPAGPTAQLIEEAAARHGLDQSLVKALAWYLSGWKTSAASSTGAVGVMQITGATEEWVGQTLLKRQVDRTNPQDNVEVGAAYLAFLLGRLGDEQRAVAAYLQGPGSVSKNGINAPTARALETINNLRSHFTGTTEGQTGATTAGARIEAPRDLTSAVIAAARAVASEAKVGVAGRNLATGERLDIRSGEVFPSASVNKVAILAEVLRQASAGKLKRTTAVNSDLERMIVVSDNEAANRLLDLVSEKSVNGTMASLGLGNTELHNYFSLVRGPLDPGFNQTTPAEMAALFSLIATDKLVNAEVSQEMRSLLSRAQDSSKLRRGLPAGTRLAHKSGWYASVANDAGIIYGPRGTYVLAVFTKGAPDDETGNQLVAAISKTIYEAWGR